MENGTALPAGPASAEHRVAGGEELRRKILQTVTALPPGDSRDNRRAAVRAWRQDFIRFITTQKPYLLENEDEYTAELMDGKRLDPRKIRPVLAPCKSRRDFDRFDYLRMLSAFPTRDRPGRRMKLLILDAGHPGRPVMGICCLSSPVRHLKVRDDWIDADTGLWKQARDAKLGFVLDLSTCLGVPPYSYLTSGKLLCYMMLSNELRHLYEERYGHRVSAKLKLRYADIVMLTTSGAFHRRTPQYMSIVFGGEKRFLYLGDSHGYSTFHIPSELFAAIKTFLQQSRGWKRRDFYRGTNPKLRMLRYVARDLGIPEERLARSGHPRAIYAAPLARNWRQFLLGQEDEIDGLDFPLAGLIDQWKRRWLFQRYETDKVRRQVESFDRRSARISRMLRELG